MRKLVAAALIAGLVALAVPASAPAIFHLMKIREVSGDPGGQNSAYIELQMYAGSQNQVAGHDLTFWDDDGLVLGDPIPVAELTLSGPNPSFAQNQRTILIGDSGVPGRDFDLELTPFLDATAGSNLVPAGAVCFEAEPVDCVSWGGGSFTGAARLPDGTTPFGSPLPTATAIKRSIARGCPTLLQASDDTDDATADFDPAPRDPTPNGATPVEVPCPGGGGANVFCGGKRATRVGTAGANVLRGTPGSDVIAGLGGNDTIRGLGGNDILCGGPGRDTLIGGPGRDRLVGGPGNDVLQGGPGNDILRGGPGRDILRGGPGRNQLFQ